MYLRLFFCIIRSLSNINFMSVLTYLLFNYFFKLEVCSPQTVFYQTILSCLVKIFCFAHTCSRNSAINQHCTAVFSNLKKLIWEFFLRFWTHCTVTTVVHTDCRHHLSPLAFTSIFFAKMWCTFQCLLKADPCGRLRALVGKKENRKIYLCCKQFVCGCVSTVKNCVLVNAQMSFFTLT